MAVHIRLARHGRTHRPFYRVVAIDQREHREGRACEILGTYDPMLSEKNITVDIDRVHAWIRQGAQYTNNLAAVLAFGGYELYPEDVLERRQKHIVRRKARRKARPKKDGAKWQKPSRRSVRKHRTQLKAQHKTQLAAEQAKQAPTTEE
ncbi:MAG: 30S ribosomal protein S16 [Planctomycetota bacterium]